MASYTPPPAHYRTGPTPEESEQYEELLRQWYLEKRGIEPPTGKERGRTAAIEAALLMFPYGRAYRYGKGAYQAGLPGLKAQWASRSGSAPIGSSFDHTPSALPPHTTLSRDKHLIRRAEVGKTVDDLFVKRPGYHGTEDPFFFERGAKGVEGTVKIPSDIQKARNMKAPTFSISSSKRFADEFAGKGIESLDWGKGSLKRTIPVLIDKKATKRILDFRNPDHQKYIKSEYKKYRKKVREEIENNLVHNTKVRKRHLEVFDETTRKDLMNLNTWNKTNWHIMEAIIPQLKQRGWKAFTATEGEVINLQVMDPKIIRAYRDEAGKIISEMNEGGRVPGGGIGDFVPENLRKKQVTVHKPSKSLVKQGYSKEARLKARYKNISYFG